jgi:hypothetical protein
MAEVSQSKPDPFRASLLGGICAAAVVLAFLGLHWSLHYAGRITADLVPLMPTTKLMRPLAGAAIPVGLAIGLGAGVLRRHRVGALLVAGAVGYVATSIIATVWLKPPALGEHGFVYWLGQGMWASLTYAVVAGPPLVVALVALERLTRPPETPADADADVETEPVAQDDEATGEPEEPTAADGPAIEVSELASEPEACTMGLAEDAPAADGDESDNGLAR